MLHDQYLLGVSAPLLSPDISRGQNNHASPLSKRSPQPYGRRTADLKQVSLFSRFGAKNHDGCPELAKRNRQIVIKANRHSQPARRIFQSRRHSHRANQSVQHNVSDFALVLKRKKSGFSGRRSGFFITTAFGTNQWLPDSIYMHPLLSSRLFSSCLPIYFVQLISQALKFSDSRSLCRAKPGPLHLSGAVH